MPHFIDGNSRIVGERQFLTSELPPTGITRNNYVVSLSPEEKSMIQDVHVKLEDFSQNNAYNLSRNPIN